MWLDYGLATADASIRSALGRTPLHEHKGSTRQGRPNIARGHTDAQTDQHARTDADRNTTRHRQTDGRTDRRTDWRTD
eukprot:15463820-Alexandrium_andersonii.AAC.1